MLSCHKKQVLPSPVTLSFTKSGEREGSNGLPLSPQVRGSTPATPLSDGGAECSGTRCTLLETKWEWPSPPIYA